MLIKYIRLSCEEHEALYVNYLIMFGTGRLVITIMVTYPANDMFSWSGLGSSSVSDPLEYNIPKGFLYFPVLVIIIAHVFY